MQSTGVAHLLCDPCKLRKPLDPASAVRSSCWCPGSAASSPLMVTGQPGVLQEPNEPSAFPGTHLDELWCFLLSQKWIFQWTAQGSSYSGTFYQACTSPWKSLMELFSSVQERWESSAGLLESLGVALIPGCHRAVPVQLPGPAEPLGMDWQLLRATQGPSQLCTIQLWPSPNWGVHL